MPLSALCRTSTNDACLISGSSIGSFLSAWPTALVRKHIFMEWIHLPWCDVTLIKISVKFSPGCEPNVQLFPCTDTAYQVNINGLTYWCSNISLTHRARNPTRSSLLEGLPQTLYGETVRVQSCQLSRFRRVTHAFACFHTHSRHTSNFSRQKKMRFWAETRSFLFKLPEGSWR